MNIAIIGAGLSGAVACGALRSYSPVVFDAAPENTTGLAKHKAIMRLRLPEIGLLLGSDLKKITVDKAVLIGDKLYDKPNITANNLYSIKAYGTISNRSIGELGRVERWLITNNNKIKAEYNHKLIGIDGMSATFDTPLGLRIHDYDFAVSTMPMPAMLQITGLAKDYPVKFTYHPIHVLRISLSVKSSVNQTVYVPDKRFSTYRASLEDNTLILEAINEISKEEAAEIAIHFGIQEDQFEYKEKSTQKIGKMLPIEEETRKAIIYHLTNKLNIFSLGRFAIWKPIRTDHLLKDIELIKRLMSSSDYGRRYEGKKV